MNGPSRLALVSLALLTACSTPAGDDRTALAGPDPLTFGPVAAVLEQRCGMLDCHGTRYRNLRMWGFDGMRLAIGDVPGGSPTTGDELSASYLAIVELEPEIIAAVVRDRGADPERLTLIRKARGTENHAGGAVFSRGDTRDMCLISWLAGSMSAISCQDALALP